MSIDTSRLFIQLNNTGLQNKDTPLYQFLKQMLQSLGTASDTAGSPGPIGPPGINGAAGPMGAMGSILFLDDRDDVEIQPQIKGDQGNPGIAGPTGATGPTIIPYDGDDGIDGFPGPTGLPGINGALTFLESHTASASASINFTSISSTYDSYLFTWFNILPVTNAVNLIARVSTNGGSTYDNGANYGYSLFEATNTPFNTTLGGDSGLTQIELDHSLSNSANYGSSGWAVLFNPNGAVNKYFQSQCASLKSDAHIYISFGTGIYIITTVVNALQFLMSSGNISSGTIKMYGFQK